MGSELHGVKMPVFLALSKEPACVCMCVCCTHVRLHVCVLQGLTLKRTSGKDKKSPCGVGGCRRAMQSFPAGGFWKNLLN